MNGPDPVRRGLRITRWEESPGYPLYYAYGPRAWLCWLPRPLQKRLVTAWNRVNCFLFGHSYALEDIVEDHEPDGSFHCVNCCALLKKDWPSD